jgi:hypothetical protein
VTGTAKLIELPIEEKHVPNIYLTGTMVSDGQMFVDTKQVIVPPVQQFLSVDVKADREQYQPREEGSLSITTRDANGKPVSAEIALGLIDESVKYIQQDYAGDPRQFYYGTKRAQTVQTQSTFNQKSYARLIEGTDKRLTDGLITARQRLQQGFAGGDDKDKLLDEAEKKPSGTLQLSSVYANVGGGGRAKAAESTVTVDGLAVSDSQIFVGARNARAPEPPPPTRPGARSPGSQRFPLDHSLAAGHQDGRQRHGDGESEISRFADHLVGYSSSGYDGQSVWHWQYLDAHQTTAHRAARSAALFCGRRSGHRFGRDQ